MEAENGQIERQVDSRTKDDRDGTWGWGGGGVHKALVHSLYYQLALQMGWGCHGDGEGGLQWEQSGIPVGLGMLCWSVLLFFNFNARI